jgi:integrase
MPKLTKRVVDAAEPSVGGRQALVWDSEVKGFGLRITTGGAKSYILNYRLPDGRERRYTIGKHGSPWTCEDARAKAVEVLRNLTAGVDPLDAKARAREVLTVADLCALYLAQGPIEKPKKKPSSWAADLGHVRRHIIPLLGRRPITSLTPQDIARFQADVSNGKTAADIKTGKHGRAIVRGGKITAARATVTLTTALQFAVKGKLLPSNPGAGVQLNPTPKRERFLSELEVSAVAAALAAMEEEARLNATMADAVRLLMLTGCRKGEILGLRWEWVDLGRRLLLLPDSKTGAKAVQLPIPAVTILSAQPRSSSPFAFPGGRPGCGHVTGLQKAWVAVRKRATEISQQWALAAGQTAEAAPDLSKVRLHDLRHSFASFAVADGAALFVLGKVLGHTQARTTEKYAHLRDDPLRALTDRTAATIDGAMQAGAKKGRAGTTSAARPAPA